MGFGVFQQKPAMLSVCPFLRRVVAVETKDDVICCDAMSPFGRAGVCVKLLCCSWVSGDVITTFSLSCVCKIYQVRLIVLLLCCCYYSTTSVAKIVYHSQPLPCTFQCLLFTHGKRQKHLLLLLGEFFASWSGVRCGLNYGDGVCAYVTSSHVRVRDLLVPPTFLRSLYLFHLEIKLRLFCVSLVAIFLCCSC